MKAMFWMLMVVWVAGCSSRKSDPPPPASSAVVPPAAPNARGTMAAGSAPVPGLATPVDPDQQDPDESPPPVAPPTSPLGPQDSGVTL